MSEFLHEHGAPKLSSEDPIVHIERVGRMLTGKRLITEGTYFAAIAEISQEKLEVPIVGTLREALTKLSKSLTKSLYTHLVNLLSIRCTMAV